MVLPRYLFAIALHSICPVSYTHLVTRAMLVTILYRIENQPSADVKLKFSDVAQDGCYTSAVMWASENGIVYGVSDTAFEPETDITREQMIAVLYRYAKYKDRDLSKAESTSLDEFDDYSAVSDYAKDEMCIRDR